MEDTYRRAASVVLLRPAEVCSPDGCGTVYQVLLLHKPRKNDDWQLPQGGVEAGETVEQAAMRELFEEAGIKGAEIIGTSTHCYQYDFPESFRRFRPDHVCGQCIEFIFAMAPKDVTVMVDQKEIDGHVWVLPEQLPLYVKRKEYLAFVQKILEEAAQMIER